jgi:hypothetical protein
MNPMKILSILPVDLEAVAPHVAAQKRKDKQILASLPSRVCHSFGVAHQLLQEYPFAYDYIISTYTPDELLPRRDLVPGTRGPYGAATHHITKLLKDNPSISLALWTGAISKEIDLPFELHKRLSFILRGSAYFPGELLGVENVERDVLRGIITDRLTEFSLTLNDQGNLGLETICRRGPVEMVFQDPDHALPARPCLRKPNLSREMQTEEFLHLLNKSSVTAQEVEAFLDGHRCFPLGNDIQALRWMVCLQIEQPNQGEPPLDILFEPVWVSSHWKITGLEAPAVSRTQAPASDRQSFCRQLASALMLLRAKRDAFSRPRFRRQMADAGFAGFVPKMALVFETIESLALPRIPPDSFKTQKAMTYAELMQLAHAEMEWLADPTQLLDNRIAANERRQKCREEVAAMLGRDVGELK